MSVLDNYKCEGQMSIFDLDIWSGKTYPEHLAVTKEKISEPSSKKRLKWSKGMPAFLDLRGGRWPSAGCIMGDGWSIAWRVHDAQFWGVPQRRKRIALVADFGGESAPEILFERKSLSRDIKESGEQREKITSNVEECVGKAISFQERAGKPGGGKGILIQNERTGALSTLNNQPVCYGVDAYNHALSGDIAVTLNASSGDSPTHSGPSVMVYGISSYYSNAMKSDNPYSGIYKADTARTLDLNGGSPACNQGGMAVVFDAYQHHGWREGETCGTLTAGQNSGVRGDTPLVCIEGNGSRPSHRGDGYVESETMYTLNSTEHHAVVVENHPADSRVKVSDDGIVQTLSSRMGASNFVVRRLTPLECERLQGYPDGWTDIGEWYDSKGKKHKDADSPRYKALGNSIALPFWHYMASKMVRYLDNPTMASLFDGIGGFPLVFSRCGCEPIWASEIEEFPIAVTKIRFP